MIPIKQEPKEVTEEFARNIGGIKIFNNEKCHFCKLSTLHWHVETNTPVCIVCAQRYNVEDIK